MRRAHQAFLFKTIAIICLSGLAFTAAASSDFYMKIGDIKGESTDAKHKDWIIIESMSSPSSRADAGAATEVVAPRDAASGLPTGKRQHKPMPVASAHEVVAPRDAASGLPTGKRQHKPMMAAPAPEDGAIDKSSPDSMGGPVDASQTFSVRGLPAAAADYLRAACASGEHIKEATLGQRSTNTETVLHDVAVSCPADGSFDLNAKHQKTGHVTLMK